MSVPGVEITYPLVVASDYAGGVSKFEIFPFVISKSPTITTPSERVMVIKADTVPTPMAPRNRNKIR